MLDIGCGDGRLTIEFARRMGFNEVYGIDNDLGNIAKAEERGIKVFNGDITKVSPFGKEFFDVVLCNQVAEHLLDVDSVLEKIHNMLKPNGKLVISVPNLCSLHNRIFMLFGYQPTVVSPSNRYPFGNPVQREAIEDGLNHRHNKAFSPKAFKAMVKNYGFNIDYYFGVGIYFLPKVLLKFQPELGVDQIIIASKECLENYCFVNSQRVFTAQGA